MNRLPAYVAKLKGGALKPAVTLTTEKETIATALLDGHDGIGQVISLRLREGKPIPEGWALDSHGAPTTDPAEALKGILLAIGGYKGYGIILMVDLLTGALTDSNYGPRVKGIDQDREPARVAHSFLAVDLAAFTDVTGFKARMDAFIDEIKSSKRAEKSDVIYLPGEPEHLQFQERMEQGIPLQAKVAQESRAIGKDLGVPVKF